MSSEMIALIILAVAIVVAIILSIKKPKDFTFKLWGTVTMFIFAPVATWLVGTLYGLSEGDGFAAIGVFIIMAPILFIAGVVLFLVGAKYS